MEKIILKNGQEFKIIPMGIEMQGNRRIFKFTSELSYGDVLAAFSNEDNLSKIDYILADGSIDKTYLDCISLKSLSFNPDYQIGDGVADVYIAEISVDAAEMQVKQMQKCIYDLSNTIVMLSMK